jgi:hypothetical protein
MISLFSKDSLDLRFSSQYIFLFLGQVGVFAFVFPVLLRIYVLIMRDVVHV